MTNLNWIKRWLAASAGCCLVGASHAQGWTLECIDLRDEELGLSADYGTGGIASNLMAVRMGLSGTVTYGSDIGPCYAPSAVTHQAVGGFAFGAGAVGSVQSQFDNNLAYTFGFPLYPVGDHSYAMISKTSDPTEVPTTRFAGDGLNGFFVGASFRYFVAFWRDGDVNVNLRVDVIGDAARMQWDLTNLLDESQSLGMWFTAYCAMRTRNPGVVDSNGFNQANSPLITNTGNAKFTADRFVGYTFVPTAKPLRTERHWFRTKPNFPAYVNFEFGQSEPYGMRIEGGPTDQNKEQTAVDEILVGNYGDTTSPGLLQNGHQSSPRNRVFLGSYEQEEADILLQETSFVQIFHPQLVEAGGSRQIINYMRSTWSVSDYNFPYAVVLDAPRLIATEPSDVTGRTPNPFTIRVYVDNLYDRIDREVDLLDTKFTITLPAGMSLVSGEEPTKIKGRIANGVIDFIEWQVEVDEFLFGPQNYTVKVETVPGPTKVLTGTVVLASTPRYKINKGANLITLPWQFADTSLEAILAKVTGIDQNGEEILEPMRQGTDFQAYRWEPDTNSYTVTGSAERGRGIWLVVPEEIPNMRLRTAQPPSDQARGGYLLNLRRGWNLIGNPYNYAVRLSTLVAVAEDDPEQAITWQDLVTQQFVGPALAYFETDPNNPAGGSYKFTLGADYELQPHTGYWIFVSTFRPIRLVWPPVYAEGLPNSGRSTGETWKQTDRRWRLQLSARTSEAWDTQNWIAVAGSAKEAKTMWIPNPPAAPNQDVDLAIEEIRDGQATRMAQSVVERASRKEFKVLVTAQKAGEVTLTWPNVGSVPRNVRFKIIDKATKTTRDLRSVSAYTFKMDEPGTREFTILMEPGGVARAVIGNVLVSKPSRDVNAPFTISYALSSDASTTVRILSGTGKEIYTVTRGRADSAGENSVSWTMRDNANRAVAPGAYRVEIIAETPNGERVRKIVPVNVVR
ncbi:MAG: hypothetical protein HONBIEJF_00731 [Fimbriimonadaceae bacterium]|nr:hypothetical protein [Fimbriimonadaceae bacterium]